MSRKSYWILLRNWWHMPILPITVTAWLVSLYAYLYRIIHGQQWRVVMYVGYWSSSCFPRQLVPHTPVGAHNVTMACEHLWQLHVGTSCNIGTSTWLHARVAWRDSWRSSNNVNDSRISEAGHKILIL